MKHYNLLKILKIVAFTPILAVFLISCQLRKADYNDFLDYQSKTNIVLPNANGRLIHLDDTTHYRFFYLEKLSDDSVLVWLNGEKIKLEEFSVEYSEDLMDNVSILFIDKRISMTEVDKLFDVLGGYLLNHIIIAVANNSHVNEFFGIKLFLPPKEFLLFESDTIEDPNFVFYHRYERYSPTNETTYIYRNDSVFLNNEYIKQETLIQRYRDGFINNRKNVWYFYLDSNSTFQAYVDMYDLFISAAYEERENYSKEKYNMELKDLKKSEYNEVKKRFPVRVKRLTKEEFDNILIIVDEEIDIIEE
jgi:hypothetical protein